MNSPNVNDNTLDDEGDEEEVDFSYDVDTLSGMEGDECESW